MILGLSLLSGLLGCATAPGSRNIHAPLVAADDLTPRPLFRPPGAEPQIFFPRVQIAPHPPAHKARFIPLPGDGPQFFWPLEGRMQGADIPHGVEIMAPQGAFVRAARAGQVAVAARALAGRGATLVLTHDQGYTSIYAGVATLLVAPGAQVAQGSPIARLGTQPLHFEIRREAAPVPMLSQLPSE